MCKNFYLADFQTNDSSFFSLNHKWKLMDIHFTYHIQWYSKVIMDDGIFWLFSFEFLLDDAYSFFSSLCKINMDKHFFLVRKQQFNQAKYSWAYLTLCHNWSARLFLNSVHWLWILPLWLSTHTQIKYDFGWFSYFYHCMLIIMFIFNYNGYWCCE